MGADDEPAAEAICSLLAHSTSLRSLSVGLSKGVCEHMAQLVAALAQSRSLVHLSVEGDAPT